MCGIALIVSCVQIEVENLVSEFVCPLPHHPKQELFSIDDIKMALHRRGPDSIQSRKLLFCAKKALSSVKEEGNITTFIHEVDAVQTYVDDAGLRMDCVLSMDEESCGVVEGFRCGVLGELYFIGATLQLRGTYPVSQPLVDASGNILVYNGEIFGGVNIDCDSNDGQSLMQLLGLCCSCRSIDHDPSCSGQNGQDSVPQLLSRIKGPWALIYWQNSSKILWFGRDAFGRRSLLVHWPTPGDSRLVLTTVSPVSPKLVKSDNHEEQGVNNLGFWEELSCGVYSMLIGDAKKDEYLTAKVKRHSWTNDNLQKLIQWKRTHVQPIPADLLTLSGRDIKIEECVHSADTDKAHSDLGLTEAAFLSPPQKVLVALREAVFRRTTLYRIYKSTEPDGGIKSYAPVAVLFSGGLDSMILAALLDQCLDPKYEIDLLNVSFDGPCAPDRITARAGVKELVKIASSRRWNLVEISAELQRLTSETSHVMSLIAPAKTYMDLNIGVALWLAARGDGWLYEEHRQDFHLVKFKSKAKILLVGSGADEQCAGYGRHRTRYRNGSWVALNEEMQLDMQRIWKRNLGRDDRCIADNGKEARFPFLDEDVIRTLLDIPLWEIADLDQPSGIGDKKILRKVAQMLGLSGAAVLPKRAIQFGSRIARESNRKNFGSNRAANQASAGSVDILLGPSSFSSAG